MGTKQPMTAQQAAIKRRIRGLTNYYYIKKGICERCGRKGYTEFNHYLYTPSTFIELCAVCHRNDKKKQYKSEVLEWLKKKPPPKSH